MYILYINDLSLVNQSLEFEDVSKNISLISGYTGTITALKQNKLLYLQGHIDFTANTYINTTIGSHYFSLQQDCIIPVFGYGSPYIQGVVVIRFHTNNQISLLVYTELADTNKKLSSLNFNGVGILQ